MSPLIITHENLHNKLGIDLGGTKIEAIVMAPDGEIICRKRIPTPRDDYPKLLDAVTALIADIESEADISAHTPLGIGTPGAVSFKTNLMKNCNSTCLNGKPLKADLEIKLGRQVRIANDADCFALSEASDGAAASASNVFGVILGTGVGGGICINRQLLAGVNAIAGEWGHNPLCLANLKGARHNRTASRPCYCGRPDCVEAWLSGHAFELSYQIRTGEHLDARKIAELAGAGATPATEVLGQYVDMLALALSGVINILDPEIIVLGGGLSNIEALYEQLPAVLEQYVFSDRVDTQVVKAHFGDSSGVRGAAWLWG